MPELPEVTTIVSQLQKEIVGQTIADVQSINGYKTTPEFKEFRQKVTGQKVMSVKRIAKNIVIQITNNIVIHLAMTGRLLLRQKDQKEDPWTRLIFVLREGPSSSRTVLPVERELRFCDARLFGFVRLMNQTELDQYASKYGPDALDENLSPTVFLAQLQKKKTVVKRALLEQEIIAGAGNIYVNDSLWLAGIHPETLTQQVTEEQATRLLTALKTILEEGIEHRGSTLGDKMYVDVYGREGEHQNYFRVFGKEGQACPRCSAIINYIDIGGRGTFFCPKCQKKPSLKKQATLF